MNILPSTLRISFMALLMACGQKSPESNDVSRKDEHSTFTPGYSEVNGIKMYYEIYGQGKPLVLIHGGGSTIQTSFEKIIPLLAAKHQIIAVELQAHGRTSDRDKASSFEQDADDVAALIKTLNVAKADFLGFSNGANTAMQIAIRHPETVNRIIPASGFYKRSGMQPWFWDAMKNATLANMPQHLKEAFLKVTPDSTKLQNLFDKDSRRMLEFRDWNEEQLRAIHAPTLIVASDSDVMTPEHAVEMFRLIPNCQLMILPGGHGEYMGEISFSGREERAATFVPLIEEFLSE
jgi:pimeloyl-ACP methyl ester carboxylesterase